MSIFAWLDHLTANEFALCVIAEYLGMFLLVLWLERRA